MGTNVNLRGDWLALSFSDSFEPMESWRLPSEFPFVGRSGTVAWNNVRVINYFPNALAMRNGSLNRLLELELVVYGSQLQHQVKDLNDETKRESISDP